MDPSVIPAVSKLLTAKQMNVRKAAEESLKNLVHSVGKTIDPRSLGANTGRPDDPGRMDRRQQVVAQLRSILDGQGHLTERATALRHLSLIATTDDVDAIAGHIHDPELREEVAFCLERIPGKVSEEALLSALPSAADDFKPRILAALGHRRADEAVAACTEAMGSGDPVIAIAGMKAWGRIGTSTGSDPVFPERDSLTEWQGIEFDDSMLRYADAQVEKGDAGEAASIYLEALDREEEHLQCAAIIGLANIGTARDRRRDLSQTGQRQQYGQSHRPQGVGEAGLRGRRGLTDLPGTISRSRVGGGIRRLEFAAGSLTVKRFDSLGRAADG